MTISELISKFSIRVEVQNGQEGLRIFGRPTAKQLQELKSKKPEIIAELKRRDAEKQAREEEERKAREQERENIKNGTIKIEVSFYDGEYLQAYSIGGEAGKLLMELGLAKNVSGWGCMVDSSLVEALGEEFTYQQAVEFITPIKEKEEQEKQEIQAKEEQRQAEIFAKAKETGEKQVLRRWTEPCNNPDEECNLDICYTYAMPDGSTTKGRYHTW